MITASLSFLIAALPFHFPPVLVGPCPWLGELAQPQVCPRRLRSVVMCSSGDLEAPVLRVRWLGARVLPQYCPSKPLCVSHDDYGVRAEGLPPDLALLLKL
jgi:hypothetical protein